MSKVWMMTALAVLAGSVFAEDPAPTYLGAVSGVVITSPTHREGFQFTPGTLGACNRQEATDWVYYQCPVTGAQATVTSDEASNPPLQVSFTTVNIYFYTTSTQDVQRQYVYNGSYASTIRGTAISSAVHLELDYSRSSPSQVRGNLALTDFGASNGVAGSQTAPPQN